MVSLSSARPIAFVLTRDREALKPFYRDVLGLKIVAEDAFATVFDLDGHSLRLTTVEDHQPSPHTVLGWAVADIRATSRALAERGVSFRIYPGFGQDELGIWTSPDGATLVNWFADPEGNVLSLTQA